MSSIEEATSIINKVIRENGKLTIKKDEELEKKDKELAALHKELVKKDEELAALHKELVKKDEELAALHNKHLKSAPQCYSRDGIASSKCEQSADKEASMKGAIKEVMNGKLSICIERIDRSLEINTKGGNVNTIMHLTVIHSHIEALLKEINLAKYLSLFDDMGVHSLFKDIINAGNNVEKLCMLSKNLQKAEMTVSIKTDILICHGHLERMHKMARDGTFIDKPDHIYQELINFVSKIDDKENDFSTFVKIVESATELCKAITKCGDNVNMWYELGKDLKNMNTIKDGHYSENDSENDSEKLQMIELSRHINTMENIAVMGDIAAMGGIAAVKEGSNDGDSNYNDDDSNYSSDTDIGEIDS